MNRMAKDDTREAVERKTVGLPRSMWAEVSDLRHDMRIKTEAAAVRLIMEAGLAATKKSARKKGVEV